MTYFHTKEEFQRNLKNHASWLEDKIEGKRANLRNADLSFRTLDSADLRSADLRSADLTRSNLRNADLCYANLSYADFSDADLRRIKVQTFFVLRNKIHKSSIGLRIGCEKHSYDHWLKNYLEIGKKAKRSDEEITECKRILDIFVFEN